MPDRVRHDISHVIAGLTRNPCIDDHRISGAAWIAGQARNDDAEVLWLSMQRT